MYHEKLAHRLLTVHAREMCLRARVEGGGAAVRTKPDLRERAVGLRINGRRPFFVRFLVKKEKSSVFQMRFLIIAERQAGFFRIPLSYGRDSPAVRAA